MPKELYTPTPSLALIRRSRSIVDKLAKDIEAYPKGMNGRGIVTCAGGYNYFPSAWVLIRMLRHLGCRLPIQLWHLGSAEVNEKMKGLVADYGVECVNGLPFIRKFAKNLGRNVKAGWILKSVALARSPFEQVMFIDADNLPIREPSFLFDSPGFKATGAIFWPDCSVFTAKSVWRAFRLSPRVEPEFESGQMVINKKVNWEALMLAEKMNYRADVFYRLMWGDKDTFRFAWHKLARSFAMPHFSPQVLNVADLAGDALCQHDFEGNRLFQHRIAFKWTLYEENPFVPGFFFENECREFLSELKTNWDGRLVKHVKSHASDVLACQKGLLNRLWLLQLPKSLENNQNSPKEIPSNPYEKHTTWLELKFHENGTLNERTNTTVGYFWDLRKSQRGLQLVLSNAKSSKVRLTRKKGCWDGVFINTKSNLKTRMLTLEDAYPHLFTKESAARHPDAARKIHDSFGPEVHLINSAHGIGDHISAVYACAGLARAGVQVVFHTQHAEWLARVAEPGLTILGEKPQHVDYNLQYDYPSQIKYGASKASWYAGGLHPLLKPATPKVNTRPGKKRLPFERYILVAPFAAKTIREWSEIHWIKLAYLLQKAGYDVVAIGTQHDEERMERIFGSTQAYWVTNHPPAWVMDAMLDAVAFVGLDSGMTHLAALLRAKAVAIHAQLEPGFLWPTGTVQSVTPKTKCVFCRWQEKGGWLNSCTGVCSALASVSPESVLDSVLEITEQKIN